MKKSKLRSPYFYLIVSLILHTTITVISYLLPTMKPNNNRRTEIELLTPDQVKQLYQRDQPSQGQIVDQDEKKLNDEKPENARFLSRHDQKVVRETKAPVVGKFQNTGGLGGVTKNTAPAKQNTKSEEKIPSKEKSVAKKIPSPEGDKIFDLKNFKPDFKPQTRTVEVENPQDGGNGVGPSQADDHLKDVATGVQTLLSTREFVYFSYYNRIKEKLRQQWEPKIKEKMEKIYRQGRQIASTSDKITKVVIILDGAGTLQRVQVISPSGLEDLDQAAVEAFRAAAPFPHPPKGIVEEDGMIRIRWDFILEANNNNGFRVQRVARSQ